MAEFRRLFLVEGKDREAVAWKEFTLYMSGEHGHGPHIQGYLDAAELVRDAMNEGDRANTLLYPRIFLLRHATELALKEAIAKRARSSAPKNLWNTHDLRFLAETFRDTYKDTMEPSWEEYHTLLAAWEAADPDGSFFRYCRSTSGKPAELEERAWITAERISQKAREAVQIIQGVAEL